jgi:DNA-binding transcriptional LysR family regulator
VKLFQREVGAVRPTDAAELVLADVSKSMVGVLSDARNRVQNRH